MRTLNLHRKSARTDTDSGTIFFVRACPAHRKAAMTKLKNISRETVSEIRQALIRIQAEHFKSDPDDAVTVAIGESLSPLSKSALTAIAAPFGTELVPSIYRLAQEKPRIFSTRTLTRWRLGQTNSELNAILLYIFIRTSYTNYLSETEEEVVMSSGGPILSAVRGAFNHEGPARLDQAKRLMGRYELVRPHPYEPDTLFVSGLLEIGKTRSKNGPKGHFDCALSYKYKHQDVSRSISMSGKIVPHGTSATMFMSNDVPVHFIFYVDYRGSGGAETDLGGIVIANTRGSDPASAWPFHARWLSPGMKARQGQLSPDEVSADVVSRHLRRGYVGWKPA